MSAIDLRGPAPGSPAPGALRVLTWHVHGTYLYYLAQTPVQFLLPIRPGRPEGYGGRSGTFEWPDNVVEVPADEVRDLAFDLVLYQSRKNHAVDGRELLGDRLQRLPAIYLEHDPPLGSVTDSLHAAADGRTLIVHVTPFNALMWDNGRSPARVIDHGVKVPNDLRATHELERGIVVVNHLATRGRRLGLDVFERARRSVPLDLAGTDSQRLGGLGDLPHARLLEIERRYRFYFSPIRYTSLGLATLEAMALGLPVVGLATTELPTVIENGRSGYLDTNLDGLTAHMRRLMADLDEARRLGEGARARVEERFGMPRFRARWLETFEQVASRSRQALAGSSR